METAVYELGIYVLILGLAVQSIYRIFDPLIDLIKIKLGMMEEEEDDTLMSSSLSRKTKIEAEEHPYPFYPEEQPWQKKKKKPTWKDLVVPPIIGLVIAWFFWPLTIFHYLPFEPQFPAVSYAMTVLVISRVSNAEHDSFKTIGQFFMGLVNRVYPHKFY